MPKLRGPILSLGATGGLTKLFSLARRMGRNIIERKPIPTDAKSPAQLFNRHMFNKCIDLWHLLSEAEKAEWERLATPRHMTGYAWYISQCLRPNPGIYLPLQGGTMSGNIDMDKNRLLKLPNPTDDQEAARKKYVDDLAPGLHADTHESGGADEIDLAGMLGLLADDQHVLDAEVNALIAIHAAVATAHQDAPALITAHGISAKHRWTLNKLLKGAGPGADPTEIDVPTGKDIATGSYTGTGNTRQITTGFKCSLVIVLCTSNSGVTGCGIMMPGGSSNFGGTTRDAWFYLHATDGFHLESHGAALNENSHPS